MKCAFAIQIYVTVTYNYTIKYFYSQQEKVMIL